MSVSAAAFVIECSAWYVVTFIGAWALLSLVFAERDAPRGLNLKSTRPPRTLADLKLAA